MSSGKASKEMDPSATGEDDAACDAETRPRGTRFPLNSRRLTAIHLRSIADALGLPRSGSADQLRQCIEGHLQSEESRQVSNTLVLVQETPQVELILKLADSDGVFLETSPVYRPCSEQGVASQEALEALDATRHDLEETQAELRTARSSMEEQASHINDLQTELETYVAGGVSAELQKLKEDCQAEKEKNRQTWKVHCEHIAEQDVLVSAKDDEIASLKRQLAELRTQQRGDRGRRSQSGVDSRSPSRLRSTETSQPPVSGVGESLSEQRNVADHLLEPSPEGRSSGVPRPRRGKAPPVDQFTGENAEVQLEDWLPALERVAAWMVSK